MKIYLIRQNDGIIGAYKSRKDAEKECIEHNNKSTTERWQYYSIQEIELVE